VLIQVFPAAANLSVLIPELLSNYSQLGTATLNARHAMAWISLTAQQSVRTQCSTNYLDHDASIVALVTNVTSPLPLLLPLSRAVAINMEAAAAIDVVTSYPVAQVGIRSFSSRGTSLYSVALPQAFITTEADGVRSGLALASGQDAVVVRVPWVLVFVNLSGWSVQVVISALAGVVTFLLYRANARVRKSAVARILCSCLLSHRIVPCYRLT
jgi:hypothetical protein